MSSVLSAQSIAFLLPIAVAISAGLGIYAIRLRNAPGAIPFAVSMVLNAILACTSAMEIVSTSLAGKVFWYGFRLLAIAFVLLVWLIAVIQYTGLSRWLSTGRIAVLSVIPVMTVALFFSEAYPTLLIYNFRLDASAYFTGMLFDVGPLYWVALFYGYAIGGTSLILLGRYIRTGPSGYHGQIVMIMAGILIPLVAHIVSTLVFPQLRGNALAPVVLAVSGVPFGLALFRYHLFDFVPIARDVVLENMADLAFVLDRQDRIVDLNPAARRAIGLDSPSAVGQTIHSVLSDWSHHPVDLGRWELDVRKAEKAEIYAIGVSPINDKRSNVVGHLLILRDVTERRQIEERLRKSEAEYKTLYSNVPVGLYRRTPEGKLIAINHAMTRLFGYDSEEEFLKLNTSDTYDDPADFRTFTENLMREGTARAEIHLKKKDGTFFWGGVHSHAIKDAQGNVLHLEGSIEDITERKRIEDELKKSREKLRISEAKYRRLFQSIPVGVYQTTSEGKLLTANPALVRILGYDSEAELLEADVGRDLYENPDDRKALIRKLSEAGEVREVEEVLRRRDGRRLTVVDTTHVVRDDQRGLTYFEGALTDITERKQIEDELKKSEERFRGIAERSIDGIFEIELDGHVTYSSPAAERMFGYDSTEALGGRIWTRFSESEKPKFDSAMRLLSNGEILQGLQLRMLRKDGSALPVEISASPIIRDGRVVGAQGVVRDISERKRIDEMRERFMAAVTHELRTPLVSVKGYVDYILMGKLGPVPQKIQSGLEVVKQESDRLLSLTNDLLDVRRLESGRFHLDSQPFDFQEVVRNCLNEAKPLIRERQKLTLELPKGKLLIQGDVIRLTQALMNLIGNAAKFTPEGGEITLRVEEIGDVIQVQVSDTGIGIRKEDLGRVFEPFAAVEKPSYFKGTGLGLSITKALIEAHGGKIWAESDGVKGATFTFTLPQQKTTKQGDGAVG